MIAATFMVQLVAVNQQGSVRAMKPLCSVRDSTHTGVTNPASAPATAAWEAHSSTRSRRSEPVLIGLNRPSLRERSSGSSDAVHVLGRAESVRTLGR
jgi:hypothetical protein